MFTSNQQLKSPIDFLCIGAPRSGTSWLYSQLIKHPDIFLPPIKELHYFDGLNRAGNHALPDNNFLVRLFSNKQNNKKWRAKSKYLLQRVITGKWDEKTAWYFNFLFTKQFNDHWYTSLFQNRTKKLGGEITPAYSILNREQIKAIKHINPNIKIIYSLRNPIYRTWSSIRKRIKKQQLKVSEAEILKLLKDKPIVNRSAYYQNLTNYYHHFEKEQILITFFDELVENPKNYLKRITDFLEVKELDYNPLNLSQKVNSAPPKNIPPPIRKILAEKHLRALQNLKTIVNAETIDQWIEVLLKIDSEY